MPGIINNKKQKQKIRITDYETGTWNGEKGKHVHPMDTSRRGPRILVLHPNNLSRELTLRFNLNKWYSNKKLMKRIIDL